MSVWDVYSSRLEVHGDTVRRASFLRSADYIGRKDKENLSYHEALVDGVQREVMIINSDNLNEKTIISMPGEDLRHGADVFWNGFHWLITEKDANTELYAKCKMLQCNYLLRWVAKDNSVIERWTVVEDGTKYLTGEYVDRDFFVTRGDSRIAITITRDEYTLQLNRDNRFIVDDYDAPLPLLCYRLSKPLKLGMSFGGNGVMKFVLSECATEDSDNFELHIANYYDHFPRPEEEGSADDPPEEDPPGKAPAPTPGRGVWL